MQDLSNHAKQDIQFILFSYEFLQATINFAFNKNSSKHFFITSQFLTRVLHIPRQIGPT